MPTLVPLDGSGSSDAALRYALQSDPEEELLLLHVAASGRTADLERGKYLLERSSRECRQIRGRVHVSTRLEVGDYRQKVEQVAEEAHCERVVLGASGLGARPHLERVSPEVRGIAAALRPSVAIISAGGDDLAVCEGHEPECEETVEV